MDFPGNSKHVLGEPVVPKGKLAKENVEKVVSGEAIQRKKPLGRRFKELFFRGEFHEARGYVIAAVLLPALKNMVVDTVSKGIERTVYGDSGPRRGSSEYGRPRISYNTPIDRDRYSRSRSGMLPDQPPLSAPSRRRQDANEIILVSKEEAELVVERMADIVDKYDVATVADLYDLVGLPTTYIDNQWGWSSVRGVDVRQIREGWLIDLPPMEALR